MVSEAVSHEVVAAAEALVPRIRAARDQIERERCLPDDLVRSMSHAGLFQLHLPRSMGGPECDPLTAFRAIETLSAAEGAVGWCAMISSVIALFVSRLSADVVASMFGQPPDLRVAGSIRPEGEAHAVDGGYRVRGRWNFASGIQHANWLFCSCKVIDANGPQLTPAGLPVARVLMVPKADATVIDTWSVVGMRGTGSHDFVVDDVFVPQAHTFSLLDAVSQTSPLYHPRMMLVSSGATTSATALGLARGAIDTFCHLAADTASTMSTTPLRDRALVQTRVAEAEAMVRAARAYILSAVSAAWEAIANGAADPSRDIAQARLAMTHGMHEAVRATTLVFHAAGTNAVYEKNPLERYFRDVHVAVQHLVGRPENIEDAGKALLGLRPESMGW
jgi:alkylation response protein AidB-like acyl-CoA dehydrogenase